MSLQKITSKSLKQLWPLFAFFAFVMLTGIAVVHFVLDEQRAKDSVENLQVSLDLVGERIAHMKQTLASDLSIQVVQKKAYSADLSFSGVGMASMKKSSMAVEWLSLRDETSKVSAPAIEEWLKEVDPDDLKAKGSYFFIAESKAGGSFLVSLLPFTVGNSKELTWGFSVDALPTSWLSFPRSQSLWIVDDKVQTTLSSFGGQHQGVQFRENLDNLSETVAHHRVMDGEEWTWQKMRGSNLVVLVQNARAPWMTKSFWWLLFSTVFLVGLVPFVKYSSGSVLEWQELIRIPTITPPLFANATELQEKSPTVKAPVAPAVVEIPTSPLDRIHFHEMPDYESELLEQALELKLPTVPSLATKSVAVQDDDGSIDASELDPKEPSISDVVSDALTNHSSSIQNLNVRVNLLLESDLKNKWPSTQLQSAIEEVIKNSVEAMEDRDVRTLTISGEKNGDEIHICVEDTGVGMTDEILARAQEAFFSTKVSLGKRRGLGLNVAKRLMEISGGRISLESTPSVGTKVHLFFPEEPVEDGHVSLSRSSSDAPVVRKPTVRI